MREASSLVLCRPFLGALILLTSSPTRLAHTKSADAGFMYVMKRGPLLKSRYGLLVGLVLLVIVFILARDSFKKWSGKPVKSAGDNPQDFFVSAKSSAFRAYFRYDPRAADEWLFHSGARLMATPAPSASLTGSTD